MLQDTVIFSFNKSTLLFMEGMAPTSSYYGIMVLTVYTLKSL